MAHPKRRGVPRAPSDAYTLGHHRGFHAVAHVAPGLSRPRLEAAVLRGVGEALEDGGDPDMHTLHAAVGDRGGERAFRRLFAAYWRGVTDGVRGGVARRIARRKARAR